MRYSQCTLVYAYPRPLLSSSSKYNQIQYAVPCQLPISETFAADLQGDVDHDKRYCVLSASSFPSSLQLIDHGHNTMLAIVLLRGLKQGRSQHGLPTYCAEASAPPRSGSQPWPSCSVPPVRTSRDCRRCQSQRSRSGYRRWTTQLCVSLRVAVQEL